MAVGLQADVTKSAHVSDLSFLASATTIVNNTNSFTDNFNQPTAPTAQFRLILRLELTFPLYPRPWLEGIDHIHQKHLIRG